MVISHWQALQCICIHVSILRWLNINIPVSSTLKLNQSLSSLVENQLKNILLYRLRTVVLQNCIYNFRHDDEYCFDSETCLYCACHTLKTVFVCLFWLTGTSSQMNQRTVKTGQSFPFIPKNTIYCWEWTEDRSFWKNVNKDAFTVLWNGESEVMQNREER